MLAAVYVLGGALAVLIGITALHGWAVGLIVLGGTLAGVGVLERWGSRLPGRRL